MEGGCLLLCLNLFAGWMRGPQGLTSILLACACACVLLLVTCYTCCWVGTRTVAV
ncbi:hypothetical protein P167DRAFT_534269, partial [Morchella conica CCBAS932]